ncbi:MAG: hypothetical protein WBJ17_08670 [Natronincolaceae bacterium]|jgi:hypothetical protein|nr:hypothetical protein [Bacillota bacterium]HZX21052.1 hypothetical protein [Clostridia bacterium]
MIGNKHLRDLFEYQDEDTSINQLLELLKDKNTEFIDSLECEPVELNACNNEEIIYLTKVSALIDYHLQLHGLEVPDWLRDERLIFEKPYFHPKRISDFDKVKLQYTNPAPFRTRNVYFDLHGIERV